MGEIKFLIMDVDGTLTDGKIYMGDSGELFKAFNIKDGCGIKEILPQYGIVPVVITARTSKLLENRCRELEIEELHQGCRNKLKRLTEIIARYAENDKVYDFSNVAYVGDDLMDIPCMTAIRQAGGIAACPSDAILGVKRISSYVSAYAAGEGAVRDVIEAITANHHNNQVNDEQRVSEAIEYLKALDMQNIPVGTYHVADDFYYIMKETTTMYENECKLETHQNHIDIQWVVAGREITKLAASSELVCAQAYDEANDVAFWLSKPNLTEIQMLPGSYIVLYPGDAHMPLIATDEPAKIKLLIAKIRINKGSAAAN